MSPAAPPLRNFARLILAHDVRGKASKTAIATAFGSCQKFQPHLTTLMGKAGFRALLSRALALATAEVSWLQALHVNPEGFLEGIDELDASIGPKEADEGALVLLARLLGLLVAFIGESLTVRLVRQVWPGLPQETMDSGRGLQS